MNVVTCYKAAKIAEVSKQTISQMKRLNSESKGRYNFFRFDPESGKHGVDVDSREWKSYLLSRRSRGKLQKVNKNGEVITDEQHNNVDPLLFISIVIASVDEVLHPHSNELDEIKSKIVMKYSEALNENAN